MATTTKTPVVIDVHERNFQREVIERSRSVPVVVDFWAPWCGPCRTLGPILEGLAREFGGAFILAKLNTDENQRLAAQFRIQGIPAVKAFRDGRIVAEFVGAQPRPAVRQFIEKLVPNELDRKITEGQQFLASEEFARAESTFREVLAEKPDQPAALLGVARALFGQGNEEEGLEVLEAIPAATPEGSEAARLRGEIFLRREAGGAGEAELRAELERAPEDLEVRFQLASLLATQGRYAEALDQYLGVVQRDRSFRDDSARKAMLHIFDLLGDQPLTREYRNKLAALLFT